MPEPTSPNHGGSARASATVGAQVSFTVHEPARMALQIVAANDDGRQLTAWLDGAALPLHAVLGPEPGSRQHLVDAPPGELVITYAATVLPGSEAATRVEEAERLLMLRPSRFCPADRLIDYGGSRFPGPGADPLSRVQAITDYVSAHVDYVSGSSGPTDDALDVLLSGRGVCRDYAHLVVTLARAQGMAARFVAVYAPGLSPMDFHAVAEIEVDGTWHVADATRLAPRGSLVRICTGRDAADTAFATTLSGAADLVGLTVTAVADHGLSTDDGHNAAILT